MKVASLGLAIGMIDAEVEVELTEASGVETALTGVLEVPAVFDGTGGTAIGGIFSIAE